MEIGETSRIIEWEIRSRVRDWTPPVKRAERALSKAQLRFRNWRFRVTHGAD